MSMRKHLGRSRAFRPSGEGLEGRQLLSGTVSGTDTAGDKWTLTLQGAGTIQVVKQPDSTGNPGALDSATEINSITISGTDPTNSRLIGSVTPAAGSSGRVFFQNLIVTPNDSLKTGNPLGMQSIDMPDFYLGFTGSAVPSSPTQPIAEINIPAGINTLDFGGVDTTAFFGTNPASSPSQDGNNDQFLIKLGLPQSIGTSIICNTITSSSQAATSSTTSATQKSVVFDVNGRINLFEANQINGSTTNAPASQSFSGGTIVASFTDPLSAITGEIGFVRVGGNATNFSVVTNNYMGNMYVGGETNNVSVLMPDGVRNLYFGKGFDTSSILTHSIENFYANRGLLNSSIVSSRQIGDLKSGGDVANSTVLSGYVQNLPSVASTIQQNLADPAAATTVNIPTPTAQANGMITTFIAGNVTNSVLAASDYPASQLNGGTTQQFGEPGDALLPLGRIIARVEGAINNPAATPNMPKTAFYANTVSLTHVPVVPPHVLEPPLPLPATPISLVGVPHVFPSVNGNKTTIIANLASPGKSSPGQTAFS